MLSHGNFVMEVSVWISNSFKYSVETSNLKNFTRPLLIWGLRNQKQKVHIFIYNHVMLAVINNVWFLEKNGYCFFFIYFFLKEELATIFISITCLRQESEEKNDDWRNSTTTTTTTYVYADLPLPRDREVVSEWPWLKK